MISFHQSKYLVISTNKILSYNTVPFLHVRSTNLHGAGLLTIFTALFWAPRALAHSFSSPATYPRCLFAIHSTTLYEGSTKQVYYNTIFTALFWGPESSYPLFFHVSGYTLPIPTAAALNTSSNYNTINTALFGPLNHYQTPHTLHQ